MDFNIGNLVSGVIGAVAKVGNAVVDTAKSIISGISEIFSSVVSGAMAALGVVDVDEDGDIHFADAEELLEEKFKLFVGAFILLFGSDSSESIWDKAKNMAKDFTIGTGYSLGNNMLFGIPTHVAGMNDNNLPDSISCKAGRIVGDVASIIRSGVEIAAGVGGEVGGLVLDASGVGAIAGVPINVGSAALAADGVISGYSSFNNLAKDTTSFISSKSSNGGSGKFGSDETSYVKSSEISEKAIKSIKKKWGPKGVDAFEKAMNKGIVGAEGQNGIKPLKGKPYKGKYTHEIKVKNKEYGDFRIYGYKDSSGKMIFECFDKGLH